MCSVHKKSTKLLAKRILISSSFFEALQSTQNQNVLRTKMPLAVTTKYSDLIFTWSNHALCSAVRSQCCSLLYFDWCNTLPTTLKSNERLAMLFVVLTLIYLRPSCHGKICIFKINAHKIVSTYSRKKIASINLRHIEVSE